MRKTTIGMAIAATSFIVAMAGYQFGGGYSLLARIGIFTGIVGMGIYFLGFIEVVAERKNKPKNVSGNAGSAEE